ncbi:MAG: hypothetical protein GTN82_14400 [Candidatus Aminicenantes bacterium]|nr:hypothetical protein [Candidatus Aminicenantes bacterium]
MLTIKVDYYNEKNKDLLSQLSCIKSLNELVESGLKFKEEEFLTYTVFMEQMNLKGWRTYSELKKLLPPRAVIFKQYFDLDNGTIKSRFTGSKMNKVQTQSAGVGAALTLVSRLYGLTEADWEIIPVKKYKDLDFEIAIKGSEIASTGEEIIQVEAKGTIIEDYNISQSIVNAKKSIEEKKETQRTQYDNKNTLIGVIAGFPHENNLDAICRVLDPPPYEINEDPYKYKLLARLYFYWRQISLISKSHVLLALINRIQDIATLSDFRELSAQPLLNHRGEVFERPVSLFFSRSIVGQDLGFGEVFPINKDEFFFYGFDSEIIDLLIKQDFKEINGFLNKGRRELESEVKVLGRIRKSDLIEAHIDVSDLKMTPDKTRYEMNLVGRCFETPAGRILGYLKRAK